MQLVERTLDILTALSKEPSGSSVSEIAEKVGLPNSSTHRILASLKKAHFISQDSETKKYHLGYKVLTLCSNMIKENSFATTARPFMQELADKFNKTVTLCVMEGRNVICLDYIESKDTTMFLVRTGFAMPPHATSAGKAIQAFMPIEKVKSIYKDNNIDKLTSNTKTDLSEFLRELEQVKLLGFAVSDEELQLGVQGVACPIFDYNNKVVGSVSVTALKADDFFNEDTINALKDCADEISKNLGNDNLKKTR